MRHCSCAGVRVDELADVGGGVDVEEEGNRSRAEIRRSRTIVLASRKIMMMITMMCHIGSRHVLRGFDACTGAFSERTSGRWSGSTGRAPRVRMRRSHSRSLDSGAGSGSGIEGSGGSGMDGGGRGDWYDARGRVSRDCERLLRPPENREDRRGGCVGESGENRLAATDRPGGGT